MESLFSSVSLLLPLYAFTKCPLSHLSCLSLYLISQWLSFSFSTFSTCIVHLLSSFFSITYRIQKHTVNPVHDAIALCILTVRSIHSDEIREKQMSQLSAVYSAEAAVQRKARHEDVHTRHRRFFVFFCDRHLFLLRQVSSCC